MVGPQPLLRKEILKSFKLRGYSLRPEARVRLESLLAPLEEGEPREWIGKILDAVEEKGRGGASALLSSEDILAAVRECSKEDDCAGGGGEDDSLVILVDPFTLPRLRFSLERKKYVVDKGEKAPGIYSDADSKAELFQARYILLEQRTSRHELFSPHVTGSASAENKKKFSLKKVEYLLGTSDKLTDVIILGMITRIKADKYSLEDPTGVVHLDLTETKFQAGLYTEGCFVLVEGWYEDFTLHVIAMGFPPTESAETTRAFFGDLNFFGGPSKFCAKFDTRLAQIESDRSDSMFVFLSDVWLDKPSVQEKLNSLFSGYSAVPPTCFVFMGNFLSSPYGANDVKILKEHFRALGEMIAEYPDLVAKSRFVFVPGPTDPGFSNIFPRPPIPKYIAGELLKKVPSASLAANPCRIQYCTQEVVVFREDIVTKMCRNCIYFPESGDIPSHFSKTVISQSHLAPLPLHVCPIYWDHDRALSLYPIPDLVVVGDKFDPFTSSQLDCQVINPGSFARNEFSFKTYVPKTRLVEDSQIPDD